MDFNNNEKEQLQSGMIDDLKKQKYIHKKQIEEEIGRASGRERVWQYV